MKKAVVVKTYDCVSVGRLGKATEPNELGLVMFYPVEGEYPYRVCLNVDVIKYLD